MGPLGWVGGPQESDTLSGPTRSGLGGGWEAGGAAAVVMSCGGVRVQPADVQASRVREYVVHGSRRRNRKLRDSPLNSRFPSLYRWYICKEIGRYRVDCGSSCPRISCPVCVVNVSFLIADYERWWCRLESSAGPRSTVTPCPAPSAPLWGHSGVPEQPPKSWCPPTDWTRYLKGYTWVISDTGVIRTASKTLWKLKTNSRYNFMVYQSLAPGCSTMFIFITNCCRCPACCKYYLTSMLLIQLIYPDKVLI